MNTVFVTLCDEPYAEKAKQTLDELRTLGRWTGDVVLIAVEFDPPPIDGVRIYKTSHLPTASLVRFYETHPITKGDGRHLTKLTQWDKLQVFSYFFRQWDRVVFLDAGMRVLNDVSPLLSLDATGALLAPDEGNYPQNSTVRFGRMIDESACPDVFQSLLQAYSPDVVNRKCFTSGLFVYDTALLDRIPYSELLDAMYRYPIGNCNEMMIMNLIFSCKYDVWKPFPVRIGSQYVFGWNESGYNGTPGVWRDFLFMKYPQKTPSRFVTASDTAFVTLSDRSYLPKALRTIRELQTNGCWGGDIVLIAVDIDPEPIPGVTIHRVSHLSTDQLFAHWKTHPIQPMPDNRHYGKVYQWDKLQVFDPFFQQWDRVVFVDAGMRILDTVQPLLDLHWQGRLLAPDDADPYDNGSRFGRQLDLTANPDVTSKLLTAYGSDILMERYFNNCLFVFDTTLIGNDLVTVPSLHRLMSEYPIFLCNETGLMNLVFSYTLKCWTPFPQRVGSKYLFAWSEGNYEEKPDWRSFHFIKYSVTYP
jgi:alpha-N-acetylglucosamine transferase